MPSLLAAISQYAIWSKRLKTRLDKSLKRHRYALEKKGIASTSSLLQAVRLDLVKAYFVLAEIHNRTAAEVVRGFFADHPGIVPEILPKLDQPRLHHLGFEVHEPHDIVLPGFYHWARQLGRRLEIPVRVNGTLRFPSSANFQGRVGAYTEMMQIWVEVNGRELLIEMFDIYRPRETSWSAKEWLGVGRWQELLQNDGVFQQSNVLPPLLKGDKIWHYGIHVSDPASIEALHDTLTAFISDKRHYKLSYEKPVLNPRDTSLHTKIINQAQGLEIEFLTQNLLSLEAGDS